MANEQGFAGTVVEISTDGGTVHTPIAKVRSWNRSFAIREEDITGAEDVSGSLVIEKFKTISRGETIEMEGIAVAAVAARREPGQSALYTAAENGTEVIIRHAEPSGEGFSFTGYFTAYREQGSVEGVYTWGGTFRVNSKVAYSAP